MFIDFERESFLYMTWLGIELATFPCTGRSSNQLSHLPRALLPVFILTIGKLNYSFTLIAHLTFCNFAYAVFYFLECCSLTFSPRYLLFIHSVSVQSLSSLWKAFLMCPTLVTGSHMSLLPFKVCSYDQGLSAFECCQPQGSGTVCLLTFTCFVISTDRGSW